MFRLARLVRLSAIILVVLFFAWYVLDQAEIFPRRELAYGVTFSPRQARDLGLDWQEAFTATLDDLGVRKLRLSAYWDIVEREQGKYDWSETDWLLAEAQKRDAQIILAVGGRLPRWPECHFPGWVKEKDKAGREQATLDYITQVVTRYRNVKNIVAWQVENEPFLAKFGKCPEFDSDFLDAEIAHVKTLDRRPVIVTDSGELSDWARAASRADIFGTTMYRHTFSSLFDGYIHYPIGPSFFRVKRNLAGLIAQPNDWIVIELQGEPWCNGAYQDVSQAERDITMSPEKFDEMIEFARQAGFREFYLWGVEWWYWEKTTQNRPIFWDKAKILIKQN